LHGGIVCAPFLHLLVMARQQRLTGIQRQLDAVERRQQIRGKVAESCDEQLLKTQKIVSAQTP